jgi:nucleotide-binding universal stress UspA family protein
MPAKHVHERRWSPIKIALLNDTAPTGLATQTQVVRNREGGTQSLRRAPREFGVIAWPGACTTTGAMKRIIVPIDFSEPSRRAARFALSLANRHDARLTLYHASTLLEHAAIPADIETTRRATSIAQAQRDLDQLVAQLTDSAKGSVDIDAISNSAEPVTGILAQAGEADLIVLSTRGSSEDERLMLGSVAARVARDATCPVLVLRDDQSRLPKDGRFHHPVVAVDYSKFSQPAVELAASLADEGSVIELVHVFYAPDFDDIKELSQALGEARAQEIERLAELARNVDIAPVAVKTRSEIGRIADKLLELIDSSKTDLLVIGAHGREQSIALIGTVADRLLRQSAAPVIVLPDRATHSRE